MLMANYLRSSLFIGFLYALGANLLWGLAFVIPKLLSSFTSIEITLGRYLFYGIVSLGILLWVERKSLRNYRNIWFTALLFAFAGNIGYYFFVVFGIKYIGASVTTLVIGVLPITVSLYGNWLRREYPFSRLFTPIVLIFLGLIIVNLLGINWSQGSEEITVPQRLLGLLSSFTALVLWTWYGVANSIFLKNHPYLSSSTWSTLIGISTLFLVLITMVMMALSGNGLANIERYIRLDDDLLLFLFGSLILGIAVSWFGTLLWNKASALLPVSLVGQLIVLETISGLTYVFIADFKLPSALELFGILMIIGGVLLGINVTRR
jgi:drug/metabolite transporter (DMT)-like permease